MKHYYTNDVFNEQCQNSVDRFLMIYMVCLTYQNNIGDENAQ